MIFLMTSCYQFVYPAHVNIPLIDKKGEMNVKASGKLGVFEPNSLSMSESAVDIQFAYSPIDNLLFQSNSSIYFEGISIHKRLKPLAESHHELFEESLEGLPNQLYSEISIGYYVKFPDNLIMSANAGSGLGSNSYFLDDPDEFNLNFYRIFVQLDMGYRRKIFKYGVGVRWSFMNFIDMDISDSYMDDYLYSRHVIKPFVSISMGKDNYPDINLTAGFSFNLKFQNLEELIYRYSFWTSLGVSHYFSISK